MVKKLPSIGTIIKDLRKARGIEQDELAQKSGFSQAYISQIENGKTNPSLKALRKIAVVFGVDEKYFFEPDIKPVSLDDNELSFGHLEKDIRRFTAKSDSVPFLEFAKDLYYGGFSKDEIEAMKLLFLTKRK